MRPSQLALLHATLDAVHAHCLRSPVATLDAAHLRAVTLEHLLHAGCAVLEPAGDPRRGRLLRLDGAVVRVERVPLPARPPAAGSRRPPRPPDLRVQAPDRLDLEVHARGTLAMPPAGAGHALLDRLTRLAARTTDALLLACDRRRYDRLRRVDGDERGELAALCAAVLPPSAALGPDFEERDVDVGRGQRWAARGMVTPMVFGVQRVVVGLWMRGPGRPVPTAAPPVQLDAFPAR